jgi:hypothetical protein
MVWSPSRSGRTGHHGHPHSCDLRMPTDQPTESIVSRDPLVGRRSGQTTAPLSDRCHDPVRGPLQELATVMRRLDSMVQRHHDNKVICHRRCSERQRRAQPWVCQWLVSHRARLPRAVATLSEFCRRAFLASETVPVLVKIWGCRPAEPIYCPRPLVASSDWSLLGLLTDPHKPVMKPLSQVASSAVAGFGSRRGRSRGSFDDRLRGDLNGHRHSWREANSPRLSGRRAEIEKNSPPGSRGGVPGCSASHARVWDTCEERLPNTRLIARSDWTTYRSRPAAASISRLRSRYNGST